MLIILKFIKGIIFVYLIPLGFLAAIGKMAEDHGRKVEKWVNKKTSVCQPMEKWKTGLIKDIFLGLIFILFVISITFICVNKNIQDLEENQKVEKSIETPENKEYKKLKTHFEWLEKEVYDFIKIESEKKDVDPIFVMSVIQYESGDYCKNNFNRMKTVISHAGARGVMQVMPFHAKNPDDLFDWKFNIKKGVEYLRGGLEIGHGDMRVAARLYNQGHYGKWRDYKNWKYVSRIMRKYKKVLTDRVMVASNE